MDEINITTEKNESGEYNSVSVRFGPHFRLEINKNGEKTNFSIVATHHGFKADASKPGSELEMFIEEIRTNHPNNKVD